MTAIDWFILVSTLGGIVGYGVWKNRTNATIDDYLKGGNSARWWTVGLSVMATQASAITFLSTPGQAFHDGMGFVQFYFGLPFAVIIICLFFIPLYHKLKVFTAYEYLEERFPEPALLPKDQLLRARTRSIACQLACDTHPLNNLRVLNYLKNPLQHQETAVKKWYWHWLTLSFTALEQQLDSSPFCLTKRTI